MSRYIRLVKQNWKDAWYNKTFRRSLILGIIALAVLSVFTYFFFDYIENCAGGVVLNDWVLKRIPAKDVSIPIVFFEASTIILFIFRSTTNPAIFITFLIAFIFILITRSITIDITRLSAPTGIIELKDPIADMIYRTKCINRDLFYSGHASNLLLFYLCSNKKTDKYYILLAVISVSVLLLVQHVHYTVDVVCAPFFALGCYGLSKKITSFSPKAPLSNV